MSRVSNLEKIIGEIREEWGEGAVTTASRVRPVERIPTGIAKLDEVLGGGWPRSRVSEIWGPKSVGKSTLCCVSIAALQAAKRRTKIAYFDLENTFDGEYAASLGVDLDRLLMVRAIPAERAGDLLVKFVRAEFDMAVVDSAVGLVPLSELERSVGDESYAVLARVLSRLLPKVNVLMTFSPTAVLLVNQVRDRIGYFAGGEKSPGGHALEHYDSMKLKMRRKGQIMGKKGKKAVGYRLAVQLIKSKLGGEGNETVLNVYYGMAPR